VSRVANFEAANRQKKAHWGEAAQFEFCGQAGDLEMLGFVYPAAALAVRRKISTHSQIS
jgi:hypothetical protein